MALKRKTRNLPNLNDNEKMSFFDPVYQADSSQLNDDESDGELSGTSSSRQTFRDKTKEESNETLDADPRMNVSLRNETNNTLDQDQSLEISSAKIVVRIKQIQNSVQQAKTMLDSMERFKHLVPGSDEQCGKLRIIIENLEEQEAGYVNLLNLITLTNEERSTLINKISTFDRLMPANTNDQSNDDEGEGDDNDDDSEEEEEDEDEEEEEDVSPQRKVQLSVRPRIESKIGFNLSNPAAPPTVNTSDNEQNTRNDNSNYDSLVGSLKSDTLNWKDHQSTSGDEASDAESEKEIERNLMLQKEQLRALQGQKRALLALKKRSEQRLIEQQELLDQQTTNQKEDISENNLLSDINNLRDRLKLLRNLYDQKHQVEVQQVKISSKKSPVENENRLKNLQHVREQLDELEQIVTYYQLDLMDQPDEETTVYEEAHIQADDVERLKQLIMQQNQQTPPPATANNTDHTPKPLDKLSSELAAKRLELEQAKLALSRLQQMVKTIEPAECSPSVRSTPIQTSTTKSNKPNENDLNSRPYQSSQTPTTTSNQKHSLLSTILSPKSAEKQNSILTTNTYADAKMAAQHREIERLVESRQRLYTLKDQIASLHESMTTPRIQTKNEDSNNEASVNNQPKKSVLNAYDEKLNSSKGIRSPMKLNIQEVEDDEDDLDLYRFEGESGDGEEIDDQDEEIQPRIKQGNFHAPEDILAEHEQRLLTKKADQTEELSVQMREICRCLSTFIHEQKSFNRHIEEHLTAATKPPSATSFPSTINTGDAVFNQLQQQVLTQGLIVNLNTAYREIAVLQSEVNTLQSENTRLTSSLSSYDNQRQYKTRLDSKDNSKDSIYSLDQIKPFHPQTRSKFDEYIRNLNSNLTRNNRSENSSKSSFNSQSTGKRTAINLDKNPMETTPIKYERNATFTSERFSPPKQIHLHTKQLSDEYEISSNHRPNSAKDIPSKSFIIRRRPISYENETNLNKSNDDQKFQQNTFDDDDEDDDDSEDERQKNDLSRTIFNIQPTAFYSLSIQDLDNIDIQTVNLQVKSIMVQLIPFMRIHINDVFNHTILNHIRERIMFLFKQQPDSAQLIGQFENQFSESLGKTIEKYCGTTIRDCAADLIRDISDISFEELVKYKLFENTNNTSTTNIDEQMTHLQDKEYPNLYDSSVQNYTQETSLGDDGENDNKYQIELAESESRPLTLVGSDEEDNDSDQEEDKDSELETAVSRQDSNLNPNETSSSTELTSNGHEYVLVNRPTSNETVNESTQEGEEKKKEDDAAVES